MAQPVARAFLPLPLSRVRRFLFSLLGHPKTIRHHPFHRRRAGCANAGCGPSSRRRRRQIARARFVALHRGLEESLGRFVSSGCGRGSDGDGDGEKSQKRSGGGGCGRSQTHRSARARSRNGARDRPDHRRRPDRTDSGQLLRPCRAGGSMGTFRASVNRDERDRYRARWWSRRFLAAGARRAPDRRQRSNARRARRGIHLRAIARRTRRRAAVAQRETLWVFPRHGIRSARRNENSQRPAHAFRNGSARDRAAAIPSRRLPARGRCDVDPQASQQGQREQRLAAAVEFDRAIAVASEYTGEKSAIFVCSDVADDVEYFRAKAKAATPRPPEPVPVPSWRIYPNVCEPLDGATPFPWQSEVAPDLEGETPPAALSSTDRLTPLKPDHIETAEDVLAFGKGLGAEALHGTRENTAVFEVIRDNL